jgi:hypothetical protein
MIETDATKPEKVVIQFRARTPDDSLESSLCCIIKRCRMTLRMFHLGRTDEDRITVQIRPIHTFLHILESSMLSNGLMVTNVATV